MNVDSAWEPRTGRNHKARGVSPSKRVASFVSKPPRGRHGATSLPRDVAPFRGSEMADCPLRGAHAPRFTMAPHAGLGRWDTGPRRAWEPRTGRNHKARGVSRREPLEARGKF